MSSNPRLPFWLDLLHTVHPPRGVLLVGAGDGSSAWVKQLMQWDFPHVTLVESEETQFRTLQDRMAGHPGWSVVQHVVAAEATEVTYHRANLAIESGLLEPESLRPLWPHLATRLACTRRATTLQALMQDGHERPDWLIVDCLPALALLQGAGESLHDIDVIVARVLLGSDPLASGPAGQPALQTWLEAKGFLALDTESGRHPAIGHAVFVRDTRASLKAASERLAQAARQQHQLEEALAALEDSRARQAQDAEAEIARMAAALQQARQAQQAAETLARQQQQHIERLQQTLAQTTTEVAATRRAHADEVARLTSAQQAADKLAADRHRTIVQLRQAAAEAAVQADAAVAALARTHADEIAAARRAHADEVTQLTSAQQAADKLAADRHRTIVQLRQAATQAANQAEAAAAAQARTHADEVACLIQAQHAAETLARTQQQHIEQLQQTLAQTSTEAAAALHAHADEIARLTSAQQAADKLAADRHRTIVQLRQAAAQAETAAAAQARAHADEVARLTQTQQKAEQLHASALQRQQELASQVENQRQARATAEKQVAELRAQAQRSVRDSHGDADIDDLLDDISVYFTERSITYVDVGAYVGDVFLKLAASRRIKVREAHLYEPNPTSYQTLTSKLESCRLPTLHAYHLAVGARSEVLHFSAAQSMTRVVEPEQGSPQISNTFTTHSVSLDEQARLFTDQKIHLLKIDVEGKELEVLMGATALLQDQRIDMLYIEVGFNGQGTQQTYFADVDRFLQDKGYRVFRLYEQMNEWTEDSPFLRRCNVAYMSERFARSNPYKLTQRLQTLQTELHRLKSAQMQPLTPALS